MSIDITSSRAAEVHAPGSGSHLHFLDHLATIKVLPGSSGSMSVVEFLAPAGFAPPLHRHRDEDELFVVLDGELEVHSSGERRRAAAGGIAFLPHAVAHTFVVVSERARFVCVTATRGDEGPRFDRMVTELGVPTTEPTLPEPAGIDPSRVADVCRAHGIEILGPPPGPDRGP